METENKLPVEFKEKWVEALRSGKYQQGKGLLMVPGYTNSSSYCCLGVACIIAGVPEDKLWYDDPDNGETLYELPGEIDAEYVSRIPSMLVEGGDEEESVMNTLAYMNDGFGKWQNNSQSFQQIADYIEKNL